MKKIKLFMSAAIAVIFMVFGAASLEPVENPNPGTEDQEPGDDNNQELMDQFGQSYFLIDGSEVSFKKGEIPSGEGTGVIENLELNGQALAGGMNLITVTTEYRYTKFYITVYGVDGYLVYVPSADSVTFDPATNQYTYLIPIVFGPDFNVNIKVVITGERENGEVTEPVDKDIQYVTSLTGDIEINMFFSNEKDVDLHLLMPDGTHIFYGNRGGTYYLEDGTEVSFGLDHDSNPSCNIDGLKNENIVIPQALVQDGTYTVIVDMYSNCDPSIATNWSVVARYHGDQVVNEIGTNPAYGVYPVGAPRGDMTPVMKFTINNAASRAGGSLENATFVPFELTEAEELKLLDEGLISFD